MYAFINIASKKLIYIVYIFYNLISINAGKGKVFDLYLTVIFLFWQDFSFAQYIKVFLSLLNNVLFFMQCQYWYHVHLNNYILIYTQYIQVKSF